MKIFNETKQLVKTEKTYTARILKNLMMIEKDKLYCDLKYSSLHKYIVKELGYSDAEATIRANATRLMLKSKKAKAKIEEGSLSLTNAAEANKLIQKVKDPSRLDVIVEKASQDSSRKFKDFAARELKLERREVIVLPEFVLKQFDKMREAHGELSTFELIQILLEKELRSPVSVPATAMKRSGRAPKVANSRFIPKSVKAKVYSGACANCGQKHSLEYDHIQKFSHGGTNSADNIQVLCRACNLRKEIVGKQMGLFN